VHGVAIWFDLLFTGSEQHVTLSTSPWDGYTHWYQTRLMLASPLEVAPAHTVSGSISLSHASSKAQQCVANFSGACVLGVRIAVLSGVCVFSRIRPQCRSVNVVCVCVCVCVRACACARACVCVCVRACVCVLHVVVCCDRRGDGSCIVAVLCVAVSVKETSTTVSGHANFTDQIYR
jgi:hypothetical protein